jgi:hypothetical protein
MPVEQIGPGFSIIQKGISPILSMPIYEIRRENPTWNQSVLTNTVIMSKFNVKEELTENMLCRLAGVI